MDYKANITPGIIESYCLGLLEPEESKMVEQQARVHADVKQEIDDFMLLLENYVMSNAVHPGEHVKKKTLGLLDNLRLEEAKKIHHLPLINKFTDIITGFKWYNLCYLKNCRGRYLYMNLEMIQRFHNY